MYANTGGHVGAVIVGDYAYIITATALQVLDKSDLENIHDCGSFYLPSFQRPYQIRYDNNHLFITGDFGLAVFNIDIPVRPTLAVVYDDIGALHSIAIDDSYAYVTTHDSLLVQLDISNPRNLEAVRDVNVGMAVRNLKVDGDYAYLAGDRFLVVDISGEEMDLIGRLNQSCNNMLLLDNYACLAAGEEGFKVIDISRPNRLREIGHLNCNAYEIIYWLGTVYNSFGIRYDWDHNGWRLEYRVLEEINLADPYMPRIVSEIAMNAGADLRHISVIGDTLIIPYNRNGTILYNYDGRNIRSFTHYNYSTVALEKYGNDLLISQGRVSLDSVQDPIIPLKIVSGVDVPGLDGSRHLVIGDSFAYYPNRENGIIKLYLETRVDGVFSRHEGIQFEDHVIDLVYDNGFLYALGNNILTVYQDDREIQTFEIEFSPTALGVNGNIMTIGTLDSTVQFYQFENNRQELNELLEFPTSGRVKDFYFDGDLIYYVDNEFHIIDVSNLIEELDVIEIYNREFEGLLRKVEVNNGIAYLLARENRWQDEEAGLYLMDIENPESPDLIGQYPTRQFSSDMSIDPPYVYVAESIYLGIYDCSAALSVRVDDDPSDGSVPASYMLLSSYPNPFNSQTMIRFSIPNDGSIQLSLYNNLGQYLHEVLQPTWYNTGNHIVPFDGSGLPTGIYYLKMHTSLEFHNEKIVKIK